MSTDLKQVFRLVDAGSFSYQDASATVPAPPPDIFGFTGLLDLGVRCCSYICMSSKRIRIGQ